MPNFTLVADEITRRRLRIEARRGLTAPFADDAPPAPNAE